MECCDEVTLCSLVVLCWRGDAVPSSTVRTRVTIAADRKNLKHLFRDCDQLKGLWSTVLRRCWTRADNHSLGEVWHVRLVGTPVCMSGCMPRCAARTAVDGDGGGGNDPRPLGSAADHSCYRIVRSV